MQINYKGKEVELQEKRTYYLPLKKDEKTGKWVEWNYMTAAHGFNDNINEVFDNDLKSAQLWFNAMAFDKSKERHIVQFEIPEKDGSIKNIYIIIQRPKGNSEFKDMITKDESIFFDNLLDATAKIISHNGEKKVFAFDLPV